MARPDDFLAIAEELCQDRGTETSEARLCRAVSTVYYAVFHALAKMCADCLVGSDEEIRPNKAWVEIYRGLGHGECKTACQSADNINFPDELKNFAKAFIQLQDARHQADYDPLAHFTRDEVRVLLSLARQAVSAPDGCTAKDRKAFAAWVLITSKGAKAARKASRSAVS